MEWSEGGKWDYCNSITNKYIFLKKKATQKLSNFCRNKELSILAKGNYEQCIADQGGKA